MRLNLYHRGSPVLDAMYFLSKVAVVGGVEYLLTGISVHNVAGDLWAMTVDLTPGKFPPEPVFDRVNTDPLFRDTFSPWPRGDYFGKPAAFRRW